jgi:hypothetical protein
MPIKANTLSRKRAQVGQVHMLSQRAMKAIRSQLIHDNQ